MPTDGPAEINRTLTTGLPELEMVHSVQEVKHLVRALPLGDHLPLHGSNHLNVCRPD
jgi:hypothetical protein